MSFAIDQIAGIAENDDLGIVLLYMYALVRTKGCVNFSCTH